VQPLEQFLHHPGGNPGLLGRVDKAKENQVTQEYPPVQTKATEQAWPVQPLPTGAQQVQHVCAVIAFAFHNGTLGPEHFFRRAELHRQAQHVSRHSMRKPCRIDCSNATARTEDDVNAILVAKSLAQPMREGQIGTIPSRMEHLQGAHAGVGMHKEIKILCMASNTGIALESIRPANQKRDLRCM
jgi:hypothetical protein